MAKKVAVMVFNPVNGFGLFQYLESFYENGIPYRTFAVAETKDVKTNSGIVMKTDDVIATLKNQVDEFDALVFSCGDAIPKFEENAGEAYNQDMLAIIKAFADHGKILIGHCAAGMFFDQVGVIRGKKVAVHPYVKSLIKEGIATDEKYEVDKNLYTAQTENTVWMMMPELLEVLK